LNQGIGLGLARRFYKQLVWPVLDRHGIRHAAARIGLGSEVLGYDTTMSADHDYGPCVQLFLAEQEFSAVASTIMAEFDATLPERFEGYTVRYPTAVRPPSSGGMGMLGSDHGVELYTLPAWSDRFLGRQFDTPLTPRDWLSYGEQIFLTVTAGEVFTDGLGDLTALRSRLSWFPRDVWLYKLAAQWNRIAEERTYIGRAGQVGDEMGSRVIAARMVGNLMRLALLIEKRYAPYPKWFGSAFARLRCAPELTSLLTVVMDAKSWQERETALADACRLLANLQLAQGIPGAVAPEDGSIHARPFRFVDTVKISMSLVAAIEDEALRTRPLFGGADQFLESFALAVPDWSAAASAGLWQD